MEIIIQKDAQQASALVAAFIEREIRRKPSLVLGLATGNSPVMLYSELIRLHREHGLDFSRVTTFNLDEYLGLSPDHPASYRRFMQERLFNHINIAPEHIHLPDGLAEDVNMHCRLYEAHIKERGGIDIQVLGIGSDGHIGFNEPSSSLASRTRTKTLTSLTRRDNARFFKDPNDVPVECITMGIGTILESRVCLLLAFGKGKAKAVAGAIEGPVTAMNPASALQLHPDTRVFLDEAAASQLKLRDYYQETCERSSEWQGLLAQRDPRT
jgi:glucosamine-6-phosphate deaminase